jgi:uncharacterized SAM-binding protein YcdF (DUF218 family)
MIRLLWRTVRALLALLVLGAGVYLGGPFLLASAGRYLVTQDPLARADMVLVLSGQPYLRVPEAARLYHERMAPRILLTNEPRPRGQEELLRIGIRYPDSQELSLQLLEALRVPRDAILTIPERTDSTRTEMQIVARYLVGRSVRTLIIVTSKAHTTRAHKIFTAGLGPQVRVLMHPVPADPFDPGRWWKDRADSKQVLWEYEALADFWRLRFWALLVGEATAVPPEVTVR